MERLDRAWSVVSHLNAVVNTPELREAYNANLQKVTELQRADGPGLAASRALPRAARRRRRFASSRARSSGWSSNELRDFRLGGAELSGPDKARFLEITEKQSALMSRFEENVLDATNRYALYIDDEIASRRAAARTQSHAAREEAVRDGKSRLEAHAACAVVCAGDAVREGSQPARDDVSRLCHSRQRSVADADLDNGPVIEQLLALRAEEAKLLGFRNFAEVSLTPKMAKSPEAAIAFLRDVVARAKPHARARHRRAARVRAGRARACRSSRHGTSSSPREKLREARYDFSDNEVKQYFPEDRVLAGLFKVTETIFGVHIREVPANAWHTDVRLFEIREIRVLRDARQTGPRAPRRARSGTSISTSTRARRSAAARGWMSRSIARPSAGGVQTPVATLTCNFSRPVGGKPALFTHSEVTTLFHEFGHGLHLLLTQVEHLGTGMENVEWDAIELPSQFMENFCWEWDVVRHMSGHVDTGAPLPRALFDRMVAAKNFHAGMHFIRQLQLALFDLEVHRAGAARPRRGAMRCCNRVRDEVAVFDVPEYNRFPLQFSHIFAGGYAAGYYSYLWAEVLSADAFSLFEEMGVMSAEAGQRFRSEILGTGSSRAAEESFVAFRGRPPQIDALFRHNGLAADRRTEDRGRVHPLMPTFDSG